MVDIVVLTLAGCRWTAELGGTSWQLVAYGPADAPLAAVAAVSIVRRRPSDWGYFLTMGGRWPNIG